MASIDASSSKNLCCGMRARAGPDHSGQCLLGGLCLAEFNKPLLASCLRCAQACACVLGWGAGPSPNPCTGAFCTGAHYTACRFRGRIPPPEWHRRPCPAGRFRAIPRVRRTGRPVNTPHPRWAVWQPSQTLACAMCKTGTWKKDRDNRIENSKFRRKLEISSKFRRNFVERSAPGGW